MKILYLIIIVDIKIFFIDINKILVSLFMTGMEVLSSYLKIFLYNFYVIIYLIYYRYFQNFQ